MPQLVGPSEDGPFPGGLFAIDALPGAAGLLQGDATHRGLRLFLDLLFARAAAAPPGEGKAGFDGFLEFAVIDGLDGARFAKLESAIVQRLVNLSEKLRD